jgi:hypothetical protein
MDIIFQCIEEHLSPHLPIWKIFKVIYYLFEMLFEFIYGILHIDCIASRNFKDIHIDKNHLSKTLLYSEY